MNSYIPCFVTELMFGYSVALQNRNKIHRMTLVSIKFSHLWAETSQTEFLGFCVMKGEGLGRTKNKYIALYIFKDVLDESNFFRVHVFQNSQSFESSFLIKICCLNVFSIHAFIHSFILLNILCLAKWDVNLVCSCSHRLLSLIESRSDPVSKWALKQKSAGNLGLGA